MSARHRRAPRGPGPPSIGGGPRPEGRKPLVGKNKEARQAPVAVCGCAPWPAALELRKKAKDTQHDSNVATSENDRFPLVVTSGELTCPPGNPAERKEGAEAQCIADHHRSMVIHG